MYTGLATDNIDLEIEDFYHAPTKITYKDLLIQIRPDFATRVAKIYTPKHRPQIATIRSGNFSLPEKSKRLSHVIKLMYTLVIKLIEIILFLFDR